MIHIKRIYEKANTSDGFRILVDRLWPRGMKKEHIHIDLWLKEIAPSTGLRKWYNHETDKWEAFCKRYDAELQESPALQELQDYIHLHKTITLLTATREENHNHATALQQYMTKHLQH